MPSALQGLLDRAHVTRLRVSVDEPLCLDAVVPVCGKDVEFRTEGQFRSGVQSVEMWANGHGTHGRVVVRRPKDQQSETLPWAPRAEPVDIHLLVRDPDTGALVESLSVSACLGSPEWDGRQAVVEITTPEPSAG